jgi:hypothetical protein
MKDPLAGVITLFVNGVGLRLSYWPSLDAWVAETRTAEQTVSAAMTSEQFWVVTADTHVCPVKA